jgi:hypothetical protein
MEENQFWLRICSIAAVVLVFGMSSCTYTIHDKHDKWEKAVSNGADPMVASCALFSKERVEEASCLLMAQNRK